MVMLFRRARFIGMKRGGNFLKNTRRNLIFVPAKKRKETANENRILHKDIQVDLRMLFCVGLAEVCVSFLVRTFWGGSGFVGR